VANLPAIKANYQRRHSLLLRPAFPRAAFSSTSVHLPSFIPVSTFPYSPRPVRSYCRPWSWYFWSGAFCQGDLSPLSAWHSLIFDWAKKGKRQKDVLRLCCLLSLVLLKLHQIQAAGVATSVEDLMVDWGQRLFSLL